MNPHLTGPVVVAVDFSANAKKAVDMAIKLLSKSALGSHLVILHVTVEEQLGIKNYIVTGGDPQIIDMVNEGLNEEGQQMLQDYKAAAASHGIRAETIAIKAVDPPKAIVDKTKQLNAELLVIGSTGKTGLKKLVLGSTSQYCVDNCECNVLVVKI